MQPKPDQTDVPFGSGDEGNLLASLENYVKGRGKAGFVLVFFPGPSAGPAQSAAQAFYDDLPSEDPAVFGSSTGEGLWGGDVGYVEFQIFFLG